MSTTWYTKEGTNEHAAIADDSVDELGEISVPLVFLERLLTDAGYRMFARTNDRYTIGRHATPSTPDVDLRRYIDEYPTRAPRARRINP